MYNITLTGVNFDSFEYTPEYLCINVCRKSNVTSNQLVVVTRLMKQLYIFLLCTIIIGVS